MSTPWTYPPESGCSRVAWASSLRRGRDPLCENIDLPNNGSKAARVSTSAYSDRQPPTQPESDFSVIRPRQLLSTAILSAMGLYAYMRWVEARWLRVSRRDVRLSREGENRPPLRLLHLSDLHASGYVSLEYLERAIRTGLALKPDLICITGDFVSSRYKAWDRYANILRLLPEHAPTFACLGDHDGGRTVVESVCNGYPTTTHVRQLLEDSGIELLDNTSRSLVIHDWPLTMVGLSDLRNGHIDAESAFASISSQNGVRIVLCHNPDSKDPLFPYKWDLLLCGHTHGGQGCLPWIGAPFVPVRDTRFLEGLHRWHDRWLHITRGVGNVHGVRFYCRPEVSLLTLH